MKKLNIGIIFLLFALDGCSSITTKYEPGRIIRYECDANEENCRPCYWCYSCDGPGREVCASS